MTTNKNEYQTMLQTVASIVNFFIKSGFEEMDRKLCSHMVTEALRAAHNKRETSLGKGKYLAYEHWSKDALKLIEDQNKLPNNLTGEIRENLRHEHVIPLNFLVDSILFELPPTTSITEIVEEIERYGKIAIITRDEDRALPLRMPAGWDKHNDDIFVRYKSSGLYDNLVTRE